MKGNPAVSSATQLCCPAACSASIEPADAGLSHTGSEAVLLLHTCVSGVDTESMHGDPGEPCTGMVSLGGLPEL